MTNGAPFALGRDDKKLAWAIFAFLLVSYAYFYQAGGWNENSRFDLVRAIVENQSFTIDPFHENTGDKASFRGHYYSDKAPGLSLIAAPVYGVLTVLRFVVHSEHDFIVLGHYLTTVLTVGIASAAIGTLLFVMSRRLGQSARASVITAIGYGLGTIAFPLSTLFFGHQMAAFLLFLAFYLAYGKTQAPSTRSSILLGLVLSLAVLVEYPTAPAALIIAGYSLSRGAPARHVASLGAGLVVPGMLLLLYLWLAFDSPFRIGYDLLANEDARYEMRHHGLFGLTYPKLDVLFELLFGRYRGLLPYSPMLLLAIPGFFDKTHRRERLICAAIAIYFLLFVSSYEWWEGGSSFGSRHLAPMLPFVTLQLGPVADRFSKVTVTAVAASVFFMAVVTAVQPKPAHRLGDPFWGAIWPAFLGGHLAANNICPELGYPGSNAHEPLVENARRDAFNLGHVLGGKGYVTLLPLGTLWVVGAWAFWKATRRKRGEPGSAANHPNNERNQAQLSAEPEL